MQPVSWDDIAEYVAAGGLTLVEMAEDFTTLHVQIHYLGISDKGTTEAEFLITCQGCCYTDIRRVNHHEPGAGNILEAYLHTSSPLIADLMAHKLDSRAGCLAHEYPSNGNVSIRHLEIIGEVTLNVLCEDVRIVANLPARH